MFEFIGKWGCGSCVSGSVSNESTDIQQLFRDACDLIGVEYRNNHANSISVARRDSAAKLDAVVGPKR